jgi:hypothetical protein
MISSSGYGPHSKKTMKVKLIKQAGGALWPQDNETLNYIGTKPDGTVFIFEQAEPKRNLDQNAIFHVWCNQVDKQYCIKIGETKRFCKLHFGVPILRAEDEGFRKLYDKAILSTLSYEEKLEAMDILPVTRLMKKKQMARFLDSVQGHYAELGIILEGE